MNSYKILMVALIALLVMPGIVFAEDAWANGAYYANESYDKYVGNDKVVVDQATGTFSKYNPNVGSKWDIANDPNTYSGRAIVYVKTYENSLNPTMILRNVLAPNNTKTIEVNPNGITEIDPLAPGRYRVTLDRFDLPDETVEFDIAAGQQEPTRVVFEGQAASRLPELHPMTIKTDIDGCNVALNGLKLVKDELITVPESTKQVCKRVKVIDHEAWDETVTEVAAWDETVHHNAVTHVEYRTATVVYDGDYKSSSGGYYEYSPSDVNSIYIVDEVKYNHDHGKYKFVGGHYEKTHNGDYDVTFKRVDPSYLWSAWSSTKPIGFDGLSSDRKDTRVVTDTEAYDETIHHDAVTRIVHHSATYKYETQCHDVIVPSYQYWTYKLEGRLTVKSIDTEINNPNRIPLSGTATVVVGYTVDHNFGKLLNTNQDLENVRKTFTGRFENVAPGTNDYGNVQIVFSDRINDAIIVDDYFPQVIESSIVTDVPWGYHMNN